MSIVACPVNRRPALGWRGGDEDLQGTITKQTELDGQRKQHEWPFDYVWVRAWGAAAKDEAGRVMNTGIPYRRHVQDLLKSSYRPSEQ